MAFARRFIGFLILLLAVLLMASMSGNFSLFVDVPNLIIMGGLLIGGTLVCFSVRQVIDAFTGTLAGADAAPASARVRLQRIAVFARLYQMAWGAGLVVALLTMIAMLGDLSDPASIGTGMAVALTAPAYGAVLAEFVFNPLQQIAMNQPVRPDDNGTPGSTEADTPVPKPGQSGLWRGVTTVAVMLAFLLLPIVSFSEIKKEDAFSPQQEATYLRYLYGDDVGASAGMSPRLEASERQREREYRVLVDQLREVYRKPGAQLSEEERIRSEALIHEITMNITSSPMPEGVDPNQSHLWRLHLLEKLAEKINSVLWIRAPAA